MLDRSRGRCWTALGAAQALTALALLASPLAQAQNVTNGALLYQKIFVTGSQSCSASSCHSSSPSNGQNRISRGSNASTVQGSFGYVGQMNFLQNRLSDLEINDLAAYIAQQTGQTPTFLPTSSGTPAVTFSSATLAFGSVLVGGSRTSTTTISNSGRAALNITGITSSNAAYAVTHNCPASVAIGGTCTVSVTFTPTAASASSATVSVASNAATSPSTLSVSGTGTTAATALLAWAANSTSASFPVTSVGNSADPLTLTLNSSGTVSATLSAVSLTGTDSSEFSLGGTCTSGKVLTAGSTCTVTVVLTPTSGGPKTASLQVTASNATNPAAVAVTGNALAAGSFVNANAGGGGCTLGRTDTPFDPVWALLLSLASGVLVWRHRQSRRQES